MVGEVLTLQQENGNRHDIHTVAVIKNDQIVGHVPRTISNVTWHFLNHGGHIDCQVTGHRKFGHGLEIPCNYKYYGSAKAIKKLSRYFTSSTAQAF